MKEKRENRNHLSWLRICMGLIFAVCFGMCLQVDADAAITKMPSKLVQTDASSNFISFRWEKGSTDKNDGPYYVWEVSEDASFTDIVRVGTASGMETMGCDELDAGKTYYVRIGIMEEPKYIPDTTQIPSDVKWTSGVAMITAPENITGNVKQTKASTSQVTISWNKADGANAYLVRYNKEKTKKYTEVMVNKNSCTLKKLSAGADYYIEICPVNKSSKFTAVNKLNASGFFTTVSNKVSGLKNLNMTDGSAYFTWNPMKNARAYELAVTKYSNKWTKKNTMTLNQVYMRKAEKVLLSNTKLKNGTFYKARVRSYILLSDGTKAYSAWSNEITFGSAPKTVNVKSNGKGIQISWSKVTGATGYQIYVLEQGKKNYQKVTTVNAKTTKYILKKINKKNLKSGKHYFIRITPIRKSGKTTASLNCKEAYKLFQKSIWFYRW